MEYNAPCTLTTPGPDITFNASSAPTYWLDAERCSGLDQAPIRKIIDPRPQTKGGIVQASLRDVRRITLGGWFIADGASARNTLEQSLRQALEAIEDEDGTFTITPTGLTALSWTVQSEIPLSTAGRYLKSFVFGLVAVNPDAA